MRRPLSAFLGITLLAVALRLWRIGHQSYWLDEAFTVNAVRGGFGAMLHAVRTTESTPPLYYTLAWAWEHMFGSGEGALRTLSALFGIATVPLAYLAARERFSERAALIAAALFAVNPYLVWYSQEARSYALLVLLAAAGLLFFLRGSLRGWAIASALALLTHYFAIFLVAPQAAWLLWHRRDRAVALAVAAPAVVALALLPLAIAQRNAGHTLFIGDIPPGRRLVSLPKKLATGELGTPTPGVGILLGAAFVVAVAIALWRYDGARLFVGLAVVPVAATLILKLAGADYLFPRNLIETFVPLLVAAAAGFAALRAGGTALAAATAIAGAALVIQVSLNASLQRDDWRGLTRALGPRAGPREMVVTPEVGKTPLRLYAGPLSRVRGLGHSVAEVDLIANARPPRYAPPNPPPGFRIASDRRTESWQLIRLLAAGPRLVGPNTLRGMRLDPRKDAALLYQP